MEALARRSGEGEGAETVTQSKKKKIDDESEQHTYTSMQGTRGVILYSIITLGTGRWLRLTLRGRICLSSVSTPLSLLPPLHHHMHLLSTLFCLSSLESTLTHCSSYHLDSFYSLLPLAINKSIQTHKKYLFLMSVQIS